MTNPIATLLLAGALCASLCACNLPSAPPASDDRDPFNPNVTGINGGSGAVQAPILNQ